MISNENKMRSLLVHKTHEPIFGRQKKISFLKFLRFIMTKIDNGFVTLLDFGYVLHHCNSKGTLYIRMTLLNMCA